MNGLQTANAPSPSVVLPHFVAASFAFVIAAILLFLSADEWMNLYFSPKLIAIVHILLLGWATMIAFGALYQLVPVVYETSLFSEKLAKVTFYLFTLSVILLSYSFWISSFAGLLIYTSLLMFFSLLLFVINLAMTYRKRTKSNIQSQFISAAIFWLAITELLGTLIALNFKFHFLSDSHIHYLKIHAHFGLLGWFLMLIMGASSILIPMFLISHETNEKKLKGAFYFTNIGLVFLSLNWLFFHINVLHVLAVLLMIVGVFHYGIYVYKVYRSRLRKVLDIPLKLSVIAIVLLLIPALIALYFLIFDAFNAETMRIIMVYGLSMVFGIITTLILGQIYKTLPFVVWLKIYQPYVGKFKTPLPRELYSEKVVQVQFYVYMIAILMSVSGILLQNIWVLKTGIFFLFITALLNLYNILKITFHKKKLTELQTHKIKIEDART